MALLPSKELLDGTKNPETTTGEFRLAMGNMRQYLSDLLGEDSTDKSHARETLGAAEKYCAHAAGTGDAITASFEPEIAQPVHNMTVFVRAKQANTSAVPTFKAGNASAIEMVKGNNRPLMVGDIAGEGHWLELRYDDLIRKWVLQNPAKGVDIPPPFEPGTTMLFVQSTAPTGWLKRTTDNDKALRVVSGQAADGGSVPFSSAFTSRSAVVSVSGTVSISGSVDATTLTVNQIPIHSHRVLAFAPGRSSPNYSDGGSAVDSKVNTEVTGGNQAHTHSINISAPLSATGSIIGDMDFSVQYVDVIIAMKVEQ